MTAEAADDQAQAAVFLSDQTGDLQLPFFGEGERVDVPERRGG